MEEDIRYFDHIESGMVVRVVTLLNHKALRSVPTERLRLRNYSLMFHVANVNSSIEITSTQLFATSLSQSQSLGRSGPLGLVSLSDCNYDHQRYWLHYIQNYLRLQLQFRRCNWVPCPFIAIATYLSSIT